MKNIILTVTTRDGEAEYTQYILLQLPDNCTTKKIKGAIHKYMRNFWGQETSYHDDCYWSSMNMQASEVDSWQEISEEDLIILKKYISI